MVGARGARAGRGRTRSATSERSVLSDSQPITRWLVRRVDDLAAGERREQPGELGWRADRELRRVVRAAVVAHEVEQRGARAGRATRCARAPPRRPTWRSSTLVARLSLVAPTRAARSATGSEGACRCCQMPESPTAVARGLVEDARSATELALGRGARRPRPAAAPCRCSRSACTMWSSTEQHAPAQVGRPCRPTSATRAPEAETCATSVGAMPVARVAAKRRS